MAATLMVQGTGSNVGKSLLVAGLARAFSRRGLVVRPFKAQNMSNNAAVTPEGGEIGRAQALQARAAGVAPSVHMNPVLLKPESETGAQIILQGQLWQSVAARDYASRRDALMPYVLDSFARLSDQADLVLVEGAGSPAEVNLRAHDIANMGFARAADVPVVLVGDIDRGGVIAQLVGTQAVIDAEDAAMIRGFVVNRFRGDPRLFDDGYAYIAARTGWAGLGVVPWFNDAARLPAEDAVEITGGGSDATHALNIVCLTLPRIANFDDLDPLKMTPGVRLTMLGRGQAIPGDADLVIIPGTKSTRADLAALRAQGWDIDLAAHVRRGGHVLGICGGYQMLGRWIDDPDGVDGAAGRDAGLGLLDISTTMRPTKRLGLVTGHDRDSGAPLSGYEIHMGQTSGADCARPWLTILDQPEGASNANARVRGTYLHGLFSSDGFRAAYLARLGKETGDLNYGLAVDRVLDGLAQHLETHMDLDALWAIARG